MGGAKISRFISRGTSRGCPMDQTRCCPASQVTQREESSHDSEEVPGSRPDPKMGFFSNRHRFGESE